MAGAFLKGLFSSDKDKSDSKSSVTGSGSSGGSGGGEPPKTFNLLVLDGAVKSDGHNWYKEFEGCVLSDGTPIKVEQSSWKLLTVSCYTHTSRSTCVTIQPSPNPIPNTPQANRRTFFPDFLLVRNEVRGINAEHDFRNVRLSTCTCIHTHTLCS